MSTPHYKINKNVYCYIKPQEYATCSFISYAHADTEKECKGGGASKRKKTKFEITCWKIIWGTPSHKSLECLQTHKDMLTLSCVHIHTHYRYMHYWWWVGRMRRKKTTDQHAEEKRWVVNFDLREWRQMPDRERKRGPDHRSSVIHIRGSHPPGPPAHPRSVEYPSIQGWAKRARRRAEMKQLREVWRSCTIVKCQSRDYFLLKPAADCSQWRLLS